MNQLPEEILTEIALQSRLSEIIKLSQINHKFNHIISNPLFWKYKFIRDYGFLPNYIDDWRHIYINYNNVYVIGKNYHNQLMIGNREYSYGLERLIGIKIKQITDNYFIDLDNRLYYFGVEPGLIYGWNDVGPLSTGIVAKYIVSTNSHSIYIDENDLAWTLDVNLEEDYDPHLNNPVPLTNFRVKFVAVGSPWNDTVIRAVIDIDDNLYIYGCNNWGQCGLGALEPLISQPRLVPDIKAKMVAFGYLHTVVLATDGSVYVAGYNSSGQLGLGQQLLSTNIFTKLSWPGNKAKYIIAVYNFTALIDIQDDLYIMGWYIPRGNPRQYEIDQDDFIYHPKKIWNGCRRVSRSHGAIVFTDLEDNVYFMGILGRKSSKNPELFHNIKANQIKCTNQGCFIIGNRINY